jgi:hypothetical protein
MRVKKINSIQNHPQITGVYFSCFLHLRRPWKTVFFKSLNPEAKAITLPIKNLEPSLVLAAKQVEAPFKQIPSHTALNDGGESVDLFSHVGFPGSYEDSILSQSMNMPPPLPPSEAAQGYLGERWS